MKEYHGGYNTKRGSKDYSTKIIKAGALLVDTRTMLSNWDFSVSQEDNLLRFQEENIFGKTSRSRVEDILRIFKQRYLRDKQVITSLVHFSSDNASGQILDPILYFLSAQSDDLLHDIVTEILFTFQAEGKMDVSVNELSTILSKWQVEGKMKADWSDATTKRVSEGLMATLRDFGILKGVQNKKIAPILLPTSSFAFIAYYLLKDKKVASDAIQDPEWRLFFLSSLAVERFFMEAHQLELLQYHAAGNIIRIEFPVESIEEYAQYVIERSN